MTLQELRERIAALTGPDREVDAEIAVALEGGEIVWKQTQYTGDSYPAIRRTNANYIGGFANEHCPLFTASLDAALGLVERVLPPAWVRLDNWSGEFRGASAAITPKPTPNGTYGATGHTMPLALLLALLKALDALSSAPTPGGEP